MDEQQFLAALYRYFGINEALRSDQSYEAISEQIKTALNAWGNRPANELWVRWTFADRVIATAWVVKPTGGEEHHAWEIPYTMSENGDIVFGTPVEVNQVQLFEPVSESQKPASKQRLVETSESTLSVIGESASGGKRIKAIGVTAGIVNGNKRRYPRAVLADAVQRLNSKLNESAGQGRLLLTGEAEHPSDKGGKANILETVFKWDAVSLNAAGQVVLEGAIIPTSKGKDLQAIAESGVPIKLSQRGYGEMQMIKEDGQSISEVTYLEITGYDAVANPSDPTAGLTESQQPPQETKKTMNLEEMLKALADKPELKEAIMKQLGLADANVLAEKLGVKNADAVQRKLEEALKAQQELEERKRQDAIEKAITEAAEDLPYEEEMNKQFIESVRALKPTTVEAVAALFESKRKEYDSLASLIALSKMGKKTDKNKRSDGTFIGRMAPVFESQTGIPEYAKPAWLLNESIVQSGSGVRRDLQKAETGSEIFTRKVLERFDQFYRSQMIAESKVFEEAEQTSDLNLPYTVMRAMIEQAFPELIAPNIFDFGTMQNSPERLYFETYTGETGAVVTVTDEVVTGDHDTWVALNQKRIRPGSGVVLTNSGGTTTYTYGTDYIIDHVEGRIKTLSTGSTTDGQSLKLDYTYDAIRKGEMGAIERAKNQLTYITINAAADRLAIQVSNEAIAFSRSQLGYDAVGRTLSNLIRDIRRRIDANIMWAALNVALAQASNSGGTWASASDPVAQLVQKMGVAKVKVENRFYTPTAFVMSKTNSDRLSNWDGFTNNGFPNAVLNAAGFAGAVKGLPIFASPEFPDGYVLVTNRELVMHRVYQPMMLKGPFPSFSSDKLVGADQYYVEEYNSTETPVAEKAAYMVIS